MSSFLPSSNDWPENLTELKSLDFLLRCGICHDFFKNCMMTKCSHNFCSYCIRKYMSTRSVCPSCFQVATEPELLSNRALDDIVKVFNVFRNRRINTETDSTKQDQSGSDTSKSSSATNAELSTHSSRHVSCPVCKKSMPLSQMDGHIDDCLNRCEEQPETKVEKVKRAYLTKKVYKIMKEKDLRDDLKKYGINSKGSKEVLINRHKKFVILYNADCDSESPMTVPELVQQLEREEAAIQENMSSDNKVFKVNCSSHPDEIDRERKAYLRQNKGHYSLLVKQAHINSEKNESKSSSSDDAKPSTSGVAPGPNSAKVKERVSSGSFSSEDSYVCVNLPKTRGLPSTSINTSNGILNPGTMDNCSDSDDKHCDLPNKLPKSPASTSGSSTEILEENSDDMEPDHDFFKSSATIPAAQQFQDKIFIISSDSDSAEKSSTSEKKRKLTDFEVKTEKRPSFRRRKK